MASTDLLYLLKSIVKKEKNSPFILIENTQPYPYFAGCMWHKANL